MGQREENVREEREEREESAYLDGTAHGSGEENVICWPPVPQTPELMEIPLIIISGPGFDSYF